MIRNISNTSCPQHRFSRPKRRRHVQQMQPLLLLPLLPPIFNYTDPLLLLQQLRPIFKKGDALPSLWLGRRTSIFVFDDFFEDTPARLRHAFFFGLLKKNWLWRFRAMIRARKRFVIRKDRRGIARGEVWIRHRQMGIEGTTKKKVWAMLQITKFAGPNGP